jgi:hypothetical protein
MFWLYDAAFFSDIFKRLAAEKNLNLHFKFGKRTGAAGVCRKKGPCEFEIEMSLPVFQRIFEPGASEVEKANGINCHNHTECFQLVMEHEMIHLLIQLLEIPVRMSHGPEFRRLASKLFGHTDFHHTLGSGLLMGREEAKALIKVGDQVKNKTRDGTVDIIVTKVNKGARGANYNGYRVGDPKKTILVVPYAFVLEVNGVGPKAEEDFED